MNNNWQKPYADNCIHDQQVRMNMLKAHNEDTKVNTDPTRRIELLVKKEIKWRSKKRLPRKKPTCKACQVVGHA